MIVSTIFKNRTIIFHLLTSIVNLGYFVFSGRVTEKVLEIKDKCLPITKKEHLERSSPTDTREGASTQLPSDPPTDTREGASTQLPSDSPTLPKSGTQSTFNPDLEVPTLPKSGTQSTFNPDLEVPKSDNQNASNQKLDSPSKGSTSESNTEPSNADTDLTGF
jgi:hypothetical protein